MADELSDSVRRLLNAHIDSLEQLEILLLLHREPSRDWTPDAVAGELRTASASAQQRLEDLRRRGLVEGVGSAYRISSSSDAQRAVSELATAYRNRRVTVINYIFSKPPVDRVRTFADAFKLRKDDENG